ncbi:MAG: histone-lysine N-methyltransferase [Candidatus Margulisbacteria bacterium GWF2_35_9]|nr:MAG: histone-lysine N-methyltransferase [Candidatus Margulisbacteria bacterium GWF2_35_9]
MEYTKSNGFLRKIKHEYPLINKTEPELYREVFPYTEVPKIIFDDHIVTFDVPEDIWITDTTFRDGQQARTPFTVKQIVDLFKLLSKLGGKKGIIRQSEFFLYSDKDKEALEEVLALNLPFPEVTGWIRAVKKDFELVKRYELAETGILTSVSDYHIFLKLNKSRREAIDSYMDIVRYSIEQGVKPRCHLEDITRSDIYGCVVPFVQELMKLSDETKVPIKIRLCDTMGYGVPYPGAALPRGIAKLAYAIKNECGVPSEMLEFHGHNDFHKVLANTADAWLHGISGANCALFGLGERTGNAPLEGMIFEYIGLKGSQDGIDTTVITDIRDYFINELDCVIPKNYPFIGDDFNTTRAGIHADGVVKNEEIYNIFDTTLLLNRPLEVSITDKSGNAGIIHWIYKHYPNAVEKGITKKHPAILKIYDAIMDEYNVHGRVTSMSDEELDKLVSKFLPELSESPYAKFKKQIQEKMFTLIKELAADEKMISMDPKQIEPLLLNLSNQDPAMKLLAVTNIDGMKITKNITQIEDRAKYETKLHSQSFSDREWFLQPMKDGETHITQIYMSQITMQPTITVSTPVFSKNDKIIGIISIDFNYDELAMELN